MPYVSLTVCQMILGLDVCGFVMHSLVLFASRRVSELCRVREFSSDPGFRHAVSESEGVVCYVRQHTRRICS